MSYSGIVVRLSKLEYNLAKDVADARQAEADRQNARPSFGSNANLLSEHHVGVLGEIAVAKAFNLYWKPTLNRFEPGDLIDRYGDRIEVKTSRHKPRLKVRKDDNCVIVGAHTVQESDGVLIVYAWVHAHIAKQHAYLINPDDRVPAYWVDRKVWNDLPNLKPPVRHPDWRIQSH